MKCCVAVHEFERSIPDVVKMLERPELLPEWTSFFKTAGTKSGIWTTMSTSIGDIQSRIEVAQTGVIRTVFIRSLIRGNEESSRLELVPVGDSTVVSFHVCLLSAETEEDRLAQEIKMWSELAKLEALVVKGVVNV